MRDTGIDKVKRADDEDPTRTRTQSKQSGRQAEVSQDGPEAPMEATDDAPMVDEVPAPSLEVEDRTMRDDFDPFNIHEEVDEALDVDVELGADAIINDNSDDFAEHT